MTKSEQSLFSRSLRKPDKASLKKTKGNSNQIFYLNKNQLGGRDQEDLENYIIKHFYRLGRVWFLYFCWFSKNVSTTWLYFYLLVIIVKGEEKHKAEQSKGDPEKDACITRRKQSQSSFGYATTYRHVMQPNITSSALAAWHYGFDVVGMHALAQPSGFRSGWLKKLWQIVFANNTACACATAHDLIRPALPHISNH